MKEIISIVLVIIGALVGAGFASGQEIYSFFYLYGINGLFGIIIMCILMALLIYKILKIINIMNIDNYNDFLKIFIKNIKINKIINIIINILLLLSFYIMIAGFGAYFEQEIGINKLIGSIILSILCGIVFFSNVKGVLKASNIIVPLLIFFIIFIGVKNFLNLPKLEIIQIKKNWIISTIIYTSYNLILLIPVLISLRKQITKEKNIKYIAIFSGIIMIILSIIIFMLLPNASISELEKQEMPAVYIISNKFCQYRAIYAFIILGSIFTTAISVGIGFLQNVSKTNSTFPQFVILMCITSLVVTNFGFSKLLNFVYPIFGYIGIIQIILILTKKLTNNIAKN